MSNMYITLTDRRPVSLESEEWPSEAYVTECDAKVREQANRLWYIGVRRHQDGRRVVYGTFEASFDQNLAGGSLLDSDATEDALVKAIRAVAHVIDNVPLGEECIQDLPAEEL